MRKRACKRCGKMVIWATSASTGMPLALEAQPHPQGQFALVAGEAHHDRPNSSWPAGTTYHHAHLLRCSGTKPPEQTRPHCYFCPKRTKHLRRHKGRYYCRNCWFMRTSEQRMRCKHCGRRPISLSRKNRWPLCATCFRDKAIRAAYSPLPKRKPKRRSLGDYAILG